VSGFDLHQLITKRQSLLFLLSVIFSNEDECRFSLQQKVL